MLYRLNYDFPENMVDLLNSLQIDPDNTILEKIRGKSHS